MTDYTLCGCGCNNNLEKYDSRGRPRRFLPGHGGYKKIKQYILPEYKLCNACKKKLEISNFGLSKTYSKITKEEYYRPKSRCFKCVANDRKQYELANPEKVIKNKQNYRAKHSGTIKYHVQEKIATWRKASSVPSNLTVDYLIDLYNKQDGYCYYTGEKMVFGWVDGKIHHNTLSLDKLIPDKGYVIGNVVWSTYLVNTMKQDLTETEFYSYIKNILCKQRNN